MFFMEHMDRENALIVSIKTISEILEWSEPTVYRQIKVLKEKFNHNCQIRNIKYLFHKFTSCLDYIRKQKEYAKFNASVLISKSEQEYRIRASKFKQLDLLDNEQATMIDIFFFLVDLTLSKV